MQKELTDLQPELIKTSAETDKLMVKIEQDTVEVEAKKEVCCQLQWSSNQLNKFVKNQICQSLWLSIYNQGTILVLKFIY